MILNLFIILLKSLPLKSGHNFFSKNISCIDSCQSKKLLSLWVFPVLIKISGFGRCFVYKLLSIFFSFILIFFCLIFFIVLINSIFEP